MKATEEVKLTRGMTEDGRTVEVEPNRESDGASGGRKKCTTSNTDQKGH